MQGRQVSHGGDLPAHLRGDQGRGREAQAAVHHPVSDQLQAIAPGRQHLWQPGVQRGLHGVGQLPGVGGRFLPTAWLPAALPRPQRHGLVGRAAGLEHGGLEAGAAGVDHQDAGVHGFSWQGLQCR